MQRTWPSTHLSTPQAQSRVPESCNKAFRDAAGKLSIGLRQRKERLAVSRLYAHLFKAM